MTGRTKAIAKSGARHALALGVVLIGGLAVAAPVSDYPPPPGPYQSEQLEPAQAAADTTDRPIPPGSSRMLPLPGIDDGTGTGNVTAERLFGAAPQEVPDAPLPEPQFAPIPDEASHTGAAYPPGPAAQPPDYAGAQPRQAAPGWPGQASGAPPYPGQPPYHQSPAAYPGRMQQPAYGGFPGGYRAPYPPAGFADGGYPGRPPQPAHYPSMRPAPPTYIGNTDDTAGYAQGPFVPQMPPAADGSGYPGRPQAPADDALFRPPALLPTQ